VRDGSVGKATSIAITPFVISTGWSRHFASERRCVPAALCRAGFAQLLPATNGVKLGNARGGYGTLKKTALANAAEAKLKGLRWCDSKHSTNALT
jgi:hypothetical protein